MSEPIFLIDESVDTSSEIPKAQALVTPKKKSKSIEGDSRPSAPVSEPKRHRRLKQSEGQTRSQASSSSNIPMTEPKKAHKGGKRPVMILGHELQLDEVVEEGHDAIGLSHSYSSPPSTFERHRTGFASVEPIPMAKLSLRSSVDETSAAPGSAPSAGVAFGSSAPSLIEHTSIAPNARVHSLSKLENSNSMPNSASAAEKRALIPNSNTGIENETDRMTIERLKSRRDLFLRAVSMTPLLPASVREDIDLMSTHTSMDDSSSDEDEDDYEQASSSPHTKPNGLKISSRRVPSSHSSSSPFFDSSRHQRSSSVEDIPSPLSQSLRTEESRYRRNARPLTSHKTFGSGSDSMDSRGSSSIDRTNSLVHVGARSLESNTDSPLRAGLQSSLQSSPPRSIAMHSSAESLFGPAYTGSTFKFFFWSLKFNKRELNLS